MSPTAPEPILHYALDVLAPGKAQTHFGKWQEAGLYWAWSGSALATDPACGVLEKVEKGVIDLTADGYLMHPILAGKLHHIGHLFGYWQTSDADRIWIQFPRGETRVYSLVWGGKSGVHRRDTLLWICPQCGNHLAERELDTGKLGLDGFIAEQLAAVRQFNSDAERRKCTACGFVHPEAYGFYPADDSEIERAARRRW